jgi:hypothetical protein
MADGTLLSPEIYGRQFPGGICSSPQSVVALLQPFNQM